MAQTSWNTNLFLAVNRYVGRWCFMDRAAIFGAKWAIYVLAIGVGVYTYRAVGRDIGQMVSVGGAVILILVLALGMSYLIAWLWPHARPETELPQSKQLIDLLPIEMWKSFPSDHTLIAFLLAYAILFWEGRMTILGLGGFIMAIYIAVSRVVVGVHYPRDILGGFILASLWGWVGWRVFGFTLSILPV